MFPLGTPALAMQRRGNDWRKRWEEAESQITENATGRWGFCPPSLFTDEKPNAWMGSDSLEVTQHISSSIILKQCYPVW